MKLTPEQEASYALDYGVNRADLKPPVQAEYDRLLAERLTGTMRARAKAPLPTAIASFQAFPPQPSGLRNWPAWLLAAGGAGVAVAVIVGGFGSPANTALDAAAALLFLSALVAVCVAVPAALLRWYRAKRRSGAQPQPVPGPFAPCYGCGYPFAVHSGGNLKCPEAGVCYRCGQPFTGHLGYELTCPAPGAITSS